MQGVTGAVVVGRDIQLTAGVGVTFGAVVLNGSNDSLVIPALSVASGITAGFWVAPVRGITAGQAAGFLSVVYNPTTKEFAYNI